MFLLYCASFENVNIFIYFSSKRNEYAILACAVVIYFTFPMILPVYEANRYDMARRGFKPPHAMPFFVYF
jgi:hypothetical protein